MSGERSQMDRLISLQAAIAETEWNMSESVSITRDDWRAIIEGLKTLPSAQPEIVRCKDCRFNTYSKKCLNPDSFFLVPADDFYCGYAERRTDERQT